MRELIEAAPHYQLAEAYGSAQMELWQAFPLGSEKARDEALWSLKIAADRHPYEPVVVGNYAVALEYLDGKIEEATPYYLKAAELSWRRENKYGALRAVSVNLARRAERHEYRLELDEALTLYLRALEYLEASWDKGYRPGGRPAFRAGQKNLRNKINLLQERGAKPHSNGEVPPPPGS